jgi:hypothetical protein
MIRITTFVMTLWALVATTVRGADEFELPPIEYSASTPENRVSRLQAAIERGETSLQAEARFGYLASLLKQLDISPETQMLVFSKTSMQTQRISPRTPRAIYFNDDTYVGYCHGGKVMEVAVADPQLGAVFYTLDQRSEAAPTPVRETHKCLQCHGTVQNEEIPALVVRSLFVDGAGMPLLSEGSHHVDHTTPLKDRWGGWYATGTHGDQTHLGNLIIRNRDAPRPWKNDEGQNVTDLTERFTTSNYLTPHSDIVALMVFEHQALVHNLITQANFAARRALHYEADLNQAMGEPVDNRLESTTRRIKNAGDKLVRGLFLVDETVLTGPIVGTSGFAKQFAESGPHDGKGRSLRELDLTTRLFKYPCSFLIYSAAFDGLPDAMQDYLATRIKEVLAGMGGAEFYRLSATDRQAISEILQETKPDFWNRAVP